MTEDRDLAPFTEIELYGAYSVSVACGAGQRFTITGDDNIVPIVITEVRDDTLNVKPEKEISTEIPLEITIACNSLSRISVVGAGSVDVTGVDSERFDIEINGAGSLAASGRVSGIDISVTGAAGVNTSNLIAETVSVTITGAGNANVHASESLGATINGTGTIQYTGDPANVSQNVSGIGVIKKK